MNVRFDLAILAKFGQLIIGQGRPIVGPILVSQIWTWQQFLGFGHSRRHFVQSDILIPSSSAIRLRFWRLQVQTRDPRFRDHPR